MPWDGKTIRLGLNMSSEVVKSNKLSIVFSQESINGYAEVSGDNNPIHIDVEFAKKTRFGRTICHGMLIYGAISEFLNQNFPNSKQLLQTLSFSSPVYANEEVTLTYEVTEETNNTLQVKVSINKNDGTLACQSLTTLQLS
jgi:acyl dehydratase